MGVRPFFISYKVIVSLLEIMIHEKVMIVKDTLERKICYTVSMSTIDHAQISQTTDTADHSPHCDTHAEAMYRALRMVGDKWTLLIIYNLLSGTRRFGELLDAMGSVSPKTVSQRLKMLEEGSFVQRQAFAEIPPRVEYRLTEKGLALVDVIEAIKRFGEQYLFEGGPTDASEPMVDALAAEEGAIHCAPTEL